MNVEKFNIECNTSAAEKSYSTQTASAMDANVWIKVEKVEPDDWEIQNYTPTDDTPECDTNRVKGPNKRNSPDSTTFDDKDTDTVKTPHELDDGCGKVKCEQSEWEARYCHPVTVMTEVPEPVEVKTEPTQDTYERQHDNNKLKLKCDMCNRSFTKQFTLKKHLSACPQRTNRDCPICDKKTKDMHTLKIHMRKHETGTPFHCEICDMRFKYKTSAQRHKKLHENRKMVPCPFCGKKFMNKCLMKPHLRTHTKEKPFQCPICLKLFAHKQNMQRHSLQHNKIKYLICDICHKEFPKESRLKYHMRVHWSDKRPFKCNHCAKCYSHKQNIMRHYRKKHPDQEYIAHDTDAGLATKAWLALLNKKQKEIKDYIVPELEPSRADDSCHNDIDRCRNDSDSRHGDDIDSCSDDGLPRPELVMVKDCSDSSDSDSDGNSDDILDLKSET